MDRWLVLEGDWGGQVYLTVPASQVGPGADIPALLAELDRAAWGCNEGEGARSFVEESSTDVGIGGGMGGGECTEGLWLHEEFQDPAWTARARELLDLRPVP